MRISWDHFCHSACGMMINFDNLIEGMRVNAIIKNIGGEICNKERMTQRSHGFTVSIVFEFRSPGLELSTDVC